MKIYIWGYIDYNDYELKIYTPSEDMLFAKWLINLCTNKIGWLDA